MASPRDLNPGYRRERGGVLTARRWGRRYQNQTGLTIKSLAINGVPTGT